MQIDHLHECAHKPCICQISTEREFCCDHCREQAENDGDTCSCGHTDCAIEPALADSPLGQMA